MLGGLVPASAVAGDRATIFYFESTEVDADAGDELTLDLGVRSNGGHDGTGLGELTMALEYDPDVLTVTDVEHGPMLTGGDADAEVDGTAEIDEERGQVVIEQERDPPGDGATAAETAATLTVEISEDAGSTSSTIEFGDIEAILVTDYPQATTGRDVTIHVDGGADGESGSDSSDGDDDSVPGFTPLAALVALTAIGGLFARRTADRWFRRP